jgi:toxin ParE1/3/4
LKQVVFAPAADAEFQAQVRRYERERLGRGERFRRPVAHAVERAAATPAAGPLHPDVPAALGIRIRLVARFPFELVYRDLGDVVRVEAVVHTSRRPGYWKPRIRR